MSTLTKALDLAEQGLAVFPLNSDRKPFGGTRGLHEATLDPGVIEEKFSDDRAEYVGVNTGRSGIIVLDLDQKNGKDGFAALEDAWLTVDPTVFYPTPNGGEHHVYLAPSEDYFKPVTNYRDLEGVDRRSGGGYVVWYGDVPNRGDFAVAPDWLCDTGSKVEEHQYDGDPTSWIMELTPGEPSAAVRRAIERVRDYPDMSHSDMVKLQFNAVRLGAEGHPGVPELVGVIRSSWMTRNPDLHTTPEDEWQSKFDEAFDSAIRKYGRQIEEVENLPAFEVDKVPQAVVDLMLGEGEASPTEWTRSLSALVSSGVDDAVVASTLWFAPRTLPLSREWGIEFVYQRIEAAKVAPLPSRENPTLGTTPEELEVEEQGRARLLSDSEVEFLDGKWTFVDQYIEKMKSLGFVNEVLARPAAWTCASMAFAFKAFIPKSGTDNMGLNLWFMTPAHSGTGKTRSRKNQNALLYLLFEGDNPEAWFQLGEDSSIQGLNLSLLQRDRQASLLDIDEASGFFERMAKTDWMTGMDSTLSHWYEGRVSPSNKISLKELRGKSALTSFNVHMLATPDRLFDTLTRDLFKTGFLARFNWVIGPPPYNGDDRFRIQQFDGNGDEVDMDQAAAPVRELATDLWAAAAMLGPKPRPILMTMDAQERMSAAYRKMYRQAEGCEDWDLIEPSITRLSETMHKIAAICAIYRGVDKIELVDALHAIKEVQVWYDNLFLVAARVSEGEFQADASEIEAFVAKSGTVTHNKLYHTFRNMVKRSRRDLDDRVEWLITSGRINRIQDKNVTKYEINGVA